MPRIIAGWAGSLQLKAPPSGTRPTSDRVREGLFSALESRDAVDGAVVLDLYAGSGALGLEAVSRGAASAVLVDQAAAAATVLRDNVRRLERAAPAAVRMQVVAKAVRAYLAAPVGEAPTLVFLDPPYDLPDDALAADLEQLARLAAPGATVVVERSRRSPEPDWPAGLAPVRIRSYGDTALHVAEA